MNTLHNDSPPRRGRPPKPAEEKLHTYTLRLTRAEIEKLRYLGGSPWVRNRLKRQKVTN